MFAGSVTYFTSFLFAMLYLQLLLKKRASVLADDSHCVNLLVAIKSLYVLNGVAAVLLYLPQIFTACKDKNHALSLSLVTFGGWSLGSLVSSLYAWLYVRDRIFTAISLGNMAGSGTIFLIVVYSRLQSRKQSNCRNAAPLL